MNKLSYRCMYDMNELVDECTNKLLESILLQPARSSNTAHVSFLSPPIESIVQLPSYSSVTSSLPPFPTSSHSPFPSSSSQPPYSSFPSSSSQPPYSSFPSSSFDPYSLENLTKSIKSFTQDSSLSSFQTNLDSLKPDRPDSARSDSYLRHSDAQPSRSSPLPGYLAESKHLGDTSRLPFYLPEHNKPSIAMPEPPPSRSNSQLSHQLTGSLSSIPASLPPFSHTSANPSALPSALPSAHYPSHTQQSFHPSIPPSFPGSGSLSSIPASLQPSNSQVPHYPSITQTFHPIPHSFPSNLSISSLPAAFVPHPETQNLLLLKRDDLDAFLSKVTNKTNKKKAYFLYSFRFIF